MKSEGELRITLHTALLSTYANNSPSPFAFVDKLRSWLLFTPRCFAFFGQIYLCNVNFLVFCALILSTMDADSEEQKALREYQAEQANIVSQRLAMMSISSSQQPRVDVLEDQENNGLGLFNFKLDTLHERKMMVMMKVKTGGLLWRAFMKKHPIHPPNQRKSHL